MEFGDFRPSGPMEFSLEAEYSARTRLVRRSLPDVAARVFFCRPSSNLRHLI